ncbi:acyl-CoA dehydrogenase family protein [Nocardiopsis nanhaiensis]
MDFTLGEELEAVRGLADEILSDRATPARSAAVEGSPTRVDEELWKELGRAGLLGVALSEETGGAGLGLAALCVLLESQGRFVAPVPVWASAIGALAVAAHGSPDQHRDLVPPHVEGTSRMTVALEEFGPAGPLAPACTAEPDGGAWRLTGVKAAVPSPFGADHVLVAAGSGQGTGLFVLATGADGVQWEEAVTTSRDLSGNLVLDGALAHAVGAPGTGVLEHTVACASTALSALQLGVVQGALRSAADHLGGREQFGRPLGSFQAVQHQLAECYIETDALRVCMWQAVSALEEQDASAPRSQWSSGTDASGTDAVGPAAAAVLVAQWWAAHAGANTVHRVQHVHGGVGVDVDFPVHRYFLWGRQIAGTLSGASATLDDLGAVLADTARDGGGAYP